MAVPAFAYGGEPVEEVEQPVLTDSSEEDAKTAFNELSDKFGSRTDVTLVKGDQPVYYFILSVE